MGWFTRTLVLLVTGLFLAFALVCAWQGDYKAATAGLFLAGLVAFFGAIGWFESKYPMEISEPGKRPRLYAEAIRYLRRYPGWPGRVAAAVLLALALYPVVAAFYRWFG